MANSLECSKSDALACEQSCVFYMYLTKTDNSVAIYNRNARIAALQGKEFSGSVATMCGGCAKGRHNEEALEEKINQLLAPNETVVLQM
jgi:hypothetical protein